jgi:hypothetical protein
MASIYTVVLTDHSRDNPAEGEFPPATTTTIFTTSDPGEAETTAVSQCHQFVEELEESPDVQARWEAQAGDYLVLMTPAPGADERLAYFLEILEGDDDEVEIVDTDLSIDGRL